MGAPTNPAIARAVRAAAYAGVSKHAIADRYRLAISTVTRLLEQPALSGIEGLQSEIDDPSTTPERRAECGVLIEDLREHARLRRS